VQWRSGRAHDALASSTLDVDDAEDASGCGHADCNDAVRVFAVVEEDGCGIDEGRCCFIKTDSVLCEIRGGPIGFSKSR
jgi:hypothetical protein